VAAVVIQMATIPMVLLVAVCHMETITQSHPVLLTQLLWALAAIKVQVELLIS
jgi:hypothetical protein